MNCVKQVKCMYSFKNLSKTIKYQCLPKNHFHQKLTNTYMSEFFDDMKIAVLQTYSYQIICTKETKFAHMTVGGMKAKQKRRKKTGKGQEHRNPFFTFQMTSLTMAAQRAHTSNGIARCNTIFVQIYMDAPPGVPWVSKNHFFFHK